MQTEIRDFNQVMYSLEEGANIITELKNRLDSDVTNLDTLKLVGTAVALLQGTVITHGSNISAIQALLTSDEVSLDDLQEVVDFIQANRDDLDALTVNNIAGLQAQLDALNTGVKNIKNLADFNALITASTAGTWNIIDDVNLNGTTATIPSGVTLKSNGGIISNGTVNLDNTILSDNAVLFDSDITINGTIRGDYIHFDIFNCEKATSTDYDTFINGNNNTFGPVPSISNRNVAILKMLIDNGFTIRYGSGIYPFDDEIGLTTGTNFYIVGSGRENGLLWFPQCYISIHQRY